MKKTVLVTGGAGYIGTHLIPKLIDKGYNIVVVDDMKNSKIQYIQSLQNRYQGKIDFYSFDLRNEEELEKIFSRYEFDGVVHFAAKKYIDESFKNPQDYLDNNVDSTKVLLTCMERHNVNKLTFASTIAVYGDVKYLPIDEKHPLNPLSPYAKSKVLCEKLISEWGRDKKAIICRFSNLSGANTNLNLGDDSLLNKKNLFTYICDNICNDRPFMFNGNDYDTKDGTTIRDYIHIDDLTQIVANLYDEVDSSCVVYVARGGDGNSVLDIMHTFERVAGKKLEYGFNPRREGDVAQITISTKKLQSLIDYKYQNDIYDIAKSQLEFYNHLNSEMEINLD